MEFIKKAYRFVRDAFRKVIDTVVDLATSTQAMFTQSSHRYRCRMEGINPKTTPVSMWSKFVGIAGSAVVVTSAIYVGSWAISLVSSGVFVAGHMLSIYARVLTTPKMIAAGGGLATAYAANKAISRQLDDDSLEAVLQ